MFRHRPYLEHSIYHPLLYHPDGPINLLIADRLTDVLRKDLEGAVENIDEMIFKLLKCAVISLQNPNLSADEVVDRALKYSETNIITIEELFQIGKAYGELLQSDPNISRYHKKVMAQKFSRINAIGSAVFGLGSTLVYILPLAGLLSNSIKAVKYAPMILNAIAGTFGLAAVTYNAETEDLHTPFDKANQGTWATAVFTRLCPGLIESLKNKGISIVPEEEEILQKLAGLNDEHAEMREILTQIVKQNKEAQSPEQMKILTQQLTEMIQSQLKDFADDLHASSREPKKKSDYLAKNIDWMYATAYYGSVLTGLCIRKITDSEELANGFVTVALGAAKTLFYLGKVWCKLMQPWEAFAGITEVLYQTANYFAGVPTQDQVVINYLKTIYQNISTLTELCKRNFICIQDNQRTILKELKHIALDLREFKYTCLTRIERVYQEVLHFHSEYNEQTRANKFIKLANHWQRLNYLLGDGEADLNKQKYYKHLLAFYQYAEATARTPSFSGYSERHLNESLIAELLLHRNADNAIGVLDKVLIHIYQHPSSQHRAENHNGEGSSQELERQAGLSNIDFRQFGNLPSPRAFRDGALAFIEALWVSEIQSPEFEDMLSDLLETGLALRNAMDFIFSDNMIRNYVRQYARDFKTKADAQGRTVTTKLVNSLEDALNVDDIVLDDNKFDNWLRGYSVDIVNGIERLRQIYVTRDRYETLILESLRREKLGKGALSDDYNVNIEFNTINGQLQESLYCTNKDKDILEFAEKEDLIQLSKPIKFRNVLKPPVRSGSYKYKIVNCKLCERSLMFKAEPFAGLEIKFDEIEMTFKLGLTETFSSVTIRFREWNIDRYPSLIARMILLINSRFASANLPLRAVPDIINDEGNFISNQNKSITILELIYYQMNNMQFCQRILFSRRFIDSLERDHFTSNLDFSASLFKFIQEFRALCNIHKFTGDFDIIKEFIKPELEKVMTADFRQEQLVTISPKKPARGSMIIRKISEKQDCDQFIELVRTSLVESIDRYFDGIEDNLLKQSQSMSNQFPIVDQVIERLYILAFIRNIPLRGLLGMTIQDFATPLDHKQCMHLLEIELKKHQNLLKVTKIESYPINEFPIANITEDITEYLGKYEQAIVVLYGDNHISALYITPKREIYYFNYVSIQIREDLQKMIENEEIKIIPSKATIPLPVQFSSVYVVASLLSMIINHEEIEATFEPIQARARFQNILTEQGKIKIRKPTTKGKPSIQHKSRSPGFFEKDMEIERRLLAGKQYIKDSKFAEALKEFSWCAQQRPDNKKIELLCQSIEVLSNMPRYGS